VAKSLKQRDYTFLSLSLVENVEISWLVNLGIIPGLLTASAVLTWGLESSQSFKTDKTFKYTYVT
jgi:hypothetical protein